MGQIILVRGGGDLASGVILRLFRTGLSVVVTELEKPLAVRRTVAFSQAVYDDLAHIEEVEAKRAFDSNEAIKLVEKGMVPVLIDPQVKSRFELNPLAIVDGRMTKNPPDLDRECAPLFIGLGPGFAAGSNCHAVVETRRGPKLGRVIWSGKPDADTGLPDTVANFQSERVLRAPKNGILTAYAEIGGHIEVGQKIAEVSGEFVFAQFSGVLRGLLKSGSIVTQGLKIGDLDPRDDPDMVRYVSDKALAVGGGVLEALLTRPEIRSQLW